MKDVPAFSQQDPLWKDIKLGFSKDSTIGKFGCLLVDLVMLANFYGFEETPETLNRKMKAVKGFDGAFIMPVYMPQAVPGMVFRGYRNCNNHPAPLDEIDSALQRGHPVIVEVDYSSKHGLQNHWVVLYEKQGKDYLIRDPWPYPAETKEVSLLSRFGFAGNAAHTILAVLWMEGPGEPPSEEVVASFPLFAATQDLALRSRPIVANDTLIKRMPLNTRLDVLTSDAEANRKVGINNEWLPVRDPEGVSGYTAAWLLARTPQEPAVEPVIGPPATSTVASFPVFATVDDLALRTRPVIAEDTLIKRLPRNTRFDILLSDQEAYPKIGAANTWLPVRDPEGSIGYTAGWLVARQPQETTPAPPPVEPPAGTPLQVRTSINNLALRSRAEVVPETLIAYLPHHTLLDVLEEAGAARSKIGVYDQWLHVQTPQGQQGYVAAWYVENLPGTLSEEGLVVNVLADNLALRSLPRVAPDTLLRRLPLGASLKVLEDPALARPKIGQFNQWLLVRDPLGSEGYVAAWYVR
ncbi:MAG: hypothetical protein Fur0018_14070 [Anaerolineales bacterium]